MATNQSLFKQYMRYLIPSVSAMIFFSIYTMVDGMFVGKGVGPVALAAVNTAMPFINFIFAISLMFSVGASTWITYHLGAGEKGRANSLFTLNILLLVGIGVTTTLLSLFFMDQLAVFLGANAETFQYVKDYLSIIMAFSTFFMVAYALEVMVKADGFPIYSIVYVSLAAVINIVFDYLFVIHFDFGIKGAAYATGLSQLISCMAFLSHFVIGKSNLKFVKIKWSFKDTFVVVKTGLPEALTELSLGFTTFAFNFVIIRTFGTPGLAAFGVLMYFNNLVVMSAIGINQAMQPLISFYKGKNDLAAARQVFKYAVQTALVFSLSFFLVSQGLTTYITRLFISPAETEAFTLAISGLKLFSIGFIFSSINIILSGYFTANHLPKIAGTLSTLRGYVLVAASLFVMPMVFGSSGVWGAAIGYEVITLFLGVGSFNRVVTTA